MNTEVKSPSKVAKKPNPKALADKPVAASHQRRQLTHQRIVDAGCSLFTRRGVAQISVEDILLEADVSRGTFYKYFTNKDDVLKALVLPVFDDLIERFSAVNQADTEVVLEAVLAGYFQQWQNHSAALVLAFNIGQANFALVQPKHDVYVRLLSELMNRIHRQGNLRLQEVSVATLLIARTVVPVLQSLQKAANFEAQFIAAMKGMLLVTD
jgi:AcrR family transcriptional regulator